MLKEWQRPTKPLHTSGGKDRFFMKIGLRCREHCPMDPRYSCGMGYTFDQEPCRTVIDGIAEIILQSEQDNGVTRVRTTSGEPGVDVYTTREEVPQYGDWRTWSRVGVIREGFFMPDKALRKN